MKAVHGPGWGSSSVGTVTLAVKVEVVVVRIAVDGGVGEKGEMDVPGQVALTGLYSWTCIERTE